MSFDCRFLLQLVLAAGLGQSAAGVANHNVIMRSEKLLTSAVQESKSGVHVDVHGIPSALVVGEKEPRTVSNAETVKDAKKRSQIEEQALIGISSAKADKYLAKADQSEQNLLGGSVGSCNTEHNPSEHSRRYSSVWGGNAIGTGHARSMLGSPQAWSAQHNRAQEWMIIDLGSTQIVGGVVTQGRTAHSQWVTRYDAHTSTQSNGPWRTGKLSCGANYDHNTKIQHHFDPRNARYVKFSNFGWHHHVSMRAGVLTCDSFTCTCTNGVGATGDACTSHNANICQRCDSGYQLHEKSCIRPECTCSEGVAATGSDCTTHNAHKCESCNSGYKLSDDDKCGKASCPSDSSGTNVLDGCTCDSGFSGQISDAVNSKGYSGECTANTCTCQDGTAATGADCTTDGEAKCSECDTGFELVTSDNTCAAAASPDEKGSAVQKQIWLAALVLLVPKLL